MNRLAVVFGAALFLSLAGNLFMAGYMIGHRASAVDAPAPPGPPRESASHEDRRAEWKKRDAELRRHLSDADRKIFEEVKARDQAKVDALRDALDAARGRVESAQNADPFDRAALEEAMRQETMAKAEFLSTVRGLRKEIAGRISPEGRALMEKFRPPKRNAKDRPNDGRRRGEFIERWRERGEGRGERPARPPVGHPSERGMGEGEPPVKPGERPDFPPDVAHPDGGPVPNETKAPGYVNPPHGQPGHVHDENCGDCEVPEGGPSLLRDYMKKQQGATDGDQPLVPDTPDAHEQAPAP